MIMWQHTCTCEAANFFLFKDVKVSHFSSTAPHVGLKVCTYLKMQHDTNFSYALVPSEVAG